MRQFTILDQTSEPQVATRYGEFACSILELAGFYVVSVATCRDGHSYTAAIYRDVQEAAEAVAALKDFALNPPKNIEAFAFSGSEDPVTALELAEALK